MTDSTGSSAGWHIDPHDRTLYRYFDGSAWTDHTAPAVAPAAPAAPAAVAVPAAPSVAVAPQVGFGYVTAQPGVSPKSWMTAWLLSFFLGGWGVDRFYLGNTGMGVAKLLVGWMTLGIWPLIDFIVIVSKNAHDGQGLRVMAEPGQLGVVPMAPGAGYGAAAPALAGPARPAVPRNLSILSMVLSLVSIVGSVLVFIGLPLAIAGLIVGIVAARREPHAKGFWLTGIIVGGIVSGLALISGIAALIQFATYSSGYYYY
jgi:TM2 domain-containing membrane protein YozV